MSPSRRKTRPAGSAPSAGPDPAASSPAHEPHSSADDAERPHNLDAWLLSAGLVVVTLVVYLPVLGHGFVSIDDHIYVTANPQVLGGLTWSGITWAFTTGYANFWHPLTWLSLMLDVLLFGTSPAGFHATNLLLHLASTLLLFAALVRMTGARYPSAFVAALFAIHPLHVESVAWISERKDVLSTGFLMLALVTWASYAERSRSQGGRGRRARYAATLALFVLGLMAKPMVVTLPVVLLLLDWWPLRRVAAGREDAGAIGAGAPGTWARWRPLVVEKIPFFAIAGAAAVVAFVAQQRGGAVASLESFPVPLRAANALVSFSAYLVKMVWPADLVVFYPYPQSLPIAGAVASLALLVAVTILAWRVRSSRPFVAVGWAWYVVTMVPVSGIVQVGSHAMADRYTYVPLVGIFLAVAWAAWQAAAPARGRRLVAAAASIGVVAAAAAIAHRQVATWKDSATLLQHAVSATPGNYYAHNGLGLELVKQGRRSEAAVHFAEASRLAPGFPNAHNNLGRLLDDEGRTDEAIAEYRRALALAPGYGQAHVNLGIALKKQTRVQDAILEFTEAIRVQPDAVDARINLGSALIDAGRSSEAIEQEQMAVDASPRSAAAHLALANALERTNRLDEAASHYQRAVDLGGDVDLAEVRTNLGATLLRLGRVDEAAAQFEVALRIAPRSAQAHNNLGNVRLQRGRPADAAEHYRAAIAVQPGFAEAHMNLGNALADLGNLPDAEREQRRAIELDPRSPAAHFNLANTLGQQGRVDEAIAHYTQTIDLEGPTPDTCLALAAAYERTGRPTRAIAFYEEAARLSPSDPLAAAGIARLQPKRGHEPATRPPVQDARQHSSGR